jgi:succinyl-CoA synthetase beta subunit
LTRLEWTIPPSAVRFPLPDRVDRIENPGEKRQGIGDYVEPRRDIGLISRERLAWPAMTSSVEDEAERPRDSEDTADLFPGMELIMMKPDLRGIFINVYGGINPIHEGAKGVIRYMQEHTVRIPVVAKALGNRQEETWEIFKSGGVHVVTEAATEKAVDVLYKLVGPGSKGGAGSAKNRAKRA